MIKHFYIVIILLFLVGGVLISLTNRNKTDKARKENWLKYASYLIIVNLIVLSIIINSSYFFYVAIVITAICLFEIIKTIYFSRNLKVGLPSLFIFLIVSFIFLLFSRLGQGVLLFTYLIVTVFDAFSQLTGQLFGKTKLVPTISPNKTWEGLFGGLASAILISMLFSSLIALPILKTMALGLVISLFAFCGDLLASISKRKFGIKDFSNLLPGQGGFVDRFDSLIFASVIVLCFDYFNLI